jgi:carboxymethylenebutenolidase
MHCPIQGHFGEDDKNPSPEDREKLAAELTKHDKAHEFYAYAGAGHAFMDNTRDSFRPSAEAQAWPRTLAFLSRYLAT